MDLIQRGQTMQTLEKENQLALCLTHVPHEAEEEFRILSSSFQSLIPSDSFFTSVILQFIHHIVEFSEESLSSIHHEIDAYILAYGLHEIHVIKYSQHMCYFLYGPRQDRSVLKKIASRMQSLYLSIGESYIAIGDTHSGIKKAYDSYSSAVILLQGSFFCDHNDILSNEDDTLMSPAIIQDFSTDFQTALSAKDQAETEQILERLVRQFRGSCVLLPSQVKDIYYKHFILLQKAAQQTQVPSFLNEDGQSIWDVIDSASTLTRLHQVLCMKTAEYFSLLLQRSPGNNIIFAIKEFIHQNYQNESLSVKSISEYVMRSAPYVCTFFKSETGQTLNQYITEYRVEKARALLEDPRYKITDVADRVGYTDVNYFGKIFRKTVGLTPSEYRGKMSK